MSKHTLPSFFSVARSIQYTDGILTGIRDDGTEVNLEVKSISVRGAKSSHGDAYELSKNDAKVTKDVNTPNPQTVDSVFLDFESKKLRLQYAMNILPVSIDRQACNVLSYTDHIDDFIKAFTSANGFKNIAELITWNIANARALWRNYAGYDRIVTVTSGDESWTFHADKLSTKKPCGHDEVPTLVTKIQQALEGKTPLLSLDVKTEVTIGRGQEVFPSQELEMKKSKNGQSKVLYSVPYRGSFTAAMHPQKIGAAIRAFDIWHPAYEKAGPLSIEPLGYSHKHQLSFRTPDTKSDIYTYLQSIDELTEELRENKVTPKSLYTAACLIRGGVFSGSADNEQKAAEKARKASEKQAKKAQKAEKQKEEDSQPMEFDLG